MHMIFKSTLLNPTGWEDIASLKIFELQQKGAFNGYFEGLVPAMELKRSSKETLDYIAHLTWIRVLKSSWFRKSSCPKTIWYFA